LRSTPVIWAKKQNNFMNSLALLNTALVFHITGIALIAGSTLLDFITISRFWKRYYTNKSDALVMREVSQVFPVVARIGIALLVLSGIAMMAIMHGVYGQQTWMRIKIGLVVLVILNLLLIGRRNGSRLFKLLNDERNGTDRTTELEKVKTAARLFHLSQLVLFLVIFTLSVFKFN
jgi:uncharacterized membrane protein